MQQSGVQVQVGMEATGYSRWFERLLAQLGIEVWMGDPQRFADGKALASYVGMIPREYSSGARQKVGGLSKPGNPLLRFLWGEAGALAARRDGELQRFYVAN